MTRRPGEAPSRAGDHPAPAVAPPDAAARRARSVTTPKPTRRAGNSPEPGPGPLTPDEFFRRIAEVRSRQVGGRRKPHKPLLLLLALGRIARGKPRLGNYADDLEEPMKRLLASFGRPGDAPRPVAPFGRLPSDGLWEIPGAETLSRTASGDLHTAPLRERRVAGGFPEPVHDLLCRQPELVERAASRLLGDNFPESLHQQIRDEVGLEGLLAAEPAGLEETGKRPRDPKFRRRVLIAYERRCAICGDDSLLGGDLLGLDAAHILWHSFGGPDTESNGLALCTLHHRAFDRGAIGLEPTGAATLAVLVSRELSGRTGAYRQLVNENGNRIRPPLEREFQPQRRFVEWHRTEVFRGEPRSR